MSVRRVALNAVLGFLAVFVLVLLVRPFIFSFAAPRDDTRYPVAASDEAANGPMLVELVLNRPHALPGEVPDGEHARLFVVVAPDDAAGFSVVDAWSPVSDCAVTLGADRLVDCAGHGWTYAGIPIDPADAGLVRFAAVEQNGAIIVDFTQPIPPGG